MSSVFRKNSIEKLVRQRLVVTMKVGHDFSGVLIHADRRRDGQYVFADVEVYLSTESGPEKLAGELYIDRVEALYVQKVPSKVPRADS